MTTELIANSPTPGTQAAIATLGSGGLTSGATSMPSGTGAPPTALQSSTGQFRIVIGSEIIIASYSSGAWGTLTRGAEGSTAASHSGGASIYHDLTAAALTALIDQAAFLPTAGGTMSGAIAMGSNKITGLTNGTASTDGAAFGQIPTAGSSTPNMDGTGSAGSATTWSKSDHVHPTDTSRAPVASPTFTGTTTAPEFSASGLTGATAASRYVGATASGAPASGTFAVGDFIIDQTGFVWVCTTAGSPGTWTQVGGGGGGSGLTQVATTGASGYTLVNSTGTILSWTAPNDGNLHTIYAVGLKVVSATETGGQISVAWTVGGSAVTINSIIGPSKTAGVWGFFESGGQGNGVTPVSVAIAPGTTFSINLFTGLTAGASIFYGNVWGA